jgi:WD40 repeat protein
VVISADERTVATGSDDRTARLWDVASGQCIATLEGHSGDVSSVATTFKLDAISGPDERMGGSGDETARMQLEWMSESAA